MQPYAPLDCSPIHSPEAIAVLCYPRYREGCARILEGLQANGVDRVCWHGSSTIVTPLGPRRILGKGHSSVVVLAISSGDLRAVKVRRSDSKRSTLRSEALLLLEASRAGAAPRPYAWEDDFIIMDYINGPTLMEAMGLLSFCHIVGEIISLARILDTVGILHLELSRPLKHVLFTNWSAHPKAIAIDFESASSGDCGNLSRIASFIIRTIRPGREDLERLRKLLREYRRRGCPQSIYYEVKTILYNITGCPR
jgi:putative serine/threonine protein kinase